MDNFATLADLTDRLDWTLDEGEERIAEAALEDLSDQARFYGKPWPDAGTAPRMVRSLVLKAAVRYMRNPDGYTTSRAGDETLAWGEDKTGQAGSAHFADIEVKALRQMAGATGIYSAPLTPWGRMRPHSRLDRFGNHVPLPAGMVPADTGSDLPMFGHEVEPW